MLKMPQLSYWRQYGLYPWLEGGQKFECKIMMIITMKMIVIFNRQTHFQMACVYPWLEGGPVRTLDLGHAEAAGCSDPDQDYDDHRDDDQFHCDDDSGS